LFQYLIKKCFFGNEIDNKNLFLDLSVSHFNRIYKLDIESLFICN